MRISSFLLGLTGLFVLSGCLYQNLEATVYLGASTKADLVLHVENVQSKDPATKLSDEQSWLIEFKTDSLPIQKHLIAAGVQTRERYLLRGVAPYSAVFTAELDNIERIVKLIDPEGRHLEATLTKTPSSLRLEIAQKPQKEEKDVENQKNFLANLMKENFRIRFVPLEGKLLKVQGMLEANNSGIFGSPVTEIPKKLVIEWEFGSQPSVL